MMNQKKHIHLYPYSDTYYGIVKHLIHQENIVYPLVPMGSSYLGKSIGFSVNREDDSATVKSIYDIQSSHVDHLILTAVTNEENLDEHIKTLIEKTLRSEGTVSYRGNDEHVLTILREIGDSLNRTEQIQFYQETFEERFDDSFVATDIPVVYLGGLIESQDSEEIALSLKHEFEKIGYRPLVISSHRDIELVSGVCLPEFFMSTQYTPDEQVKHLSSWLGQVIKEHQPDLILVDVPKGMLLYNKKISNTYGLYAMMLALALKPDFMILSMNSHEVSGTDLENYSAHLLNKTDRAVDVFHLSNRYYKIYDADYEIPDKPMYLSPQKVEWFIDQHNAKSTVPMTNLNQMNNIATVALKIIAQFS